MNIKLPPLPTSYYSFAFMNSMASGYSSEQMKSYATTAIKQDREQRGEPEAYIRKEQLEKAKRAQHLCEVHPAPRSDLVAPYTAQQPSQPERKPMPDKDCTPNHLCSGRMVHLPRGEQCDKCGKE